MRTRKQREGIILQSTGESHSTMITEIRVYQIMVSRIPKGQTYTGVSVDGNDPYDIEAGIEDLQRQIKELQSKRVTTRKQLRELKEQEELEKYLGL